MITANQWYNVAVTGNAGTRTGIRIEFDDYYALFAVAVDYGNSVITAVESNISPDTITVGARIRYSNGYWYVDVRLSVSYKEKTLDAYLYENSGWAPIETATAGSGSTLCVINYLVSLINLSNGDSLFEMINAGSDEKPVYAVVPKEFRQQRPGILSRTFVVAGGAPDDIDADNVSGGSLADLSDVEDTASDLFEEDMLLVKLKDATHWTVKSLKEVTINEEKLKEYLLWEKVNVGTEESPVWAVVPLDHEGNPVGIVSDTFITAGGRNGNSSGQGSATTLGGLANVDDTADNVLTEDVVLFKGINATHWTLRALSTLGINEEKLQTYLETNKYVTQTSLTDNKYLTKQAADELYMPISEILWERVNVGTEDNPQWAVIPVDYNGNPVGIVSDTFITSGGRKGGSSGTGSSFNRLDSWDNYNPNAGDVLSAVLGYELKTRLDNLNVGLDESKLKEYLDTNEYITKTAGNELYAPLASFNTLNTKVNDFLTGSDTNNIIDKWKELEAFLAGQTESSTLADLLIVKADQTALEAVTTRVTTVEGYFTNKAANNALKLGGQLPEYYATASALSTHISTYNTFVNDTYVAHITAYNKHITEYNTYKSATDKRLADLEALWAIDEDNNGLYPKSGRGIWSESYITAGGVGTSGGGSGTGGGLIQNVYSYADLGGTFNNNVLTDTFNAYTINQLYTSGEAIKGRVEALEANMDVINPSTLLSLNNNIAGSSARITSLEDWIENPVADVAYFNELGVRDKLNVSGPATFDERITGVITEAINLTGTPEIKITGDTIAVLVGEKASAYITVPYANNALKLGGQLPEYYATASALSAVERITSEGLSRISNLLSSIEEQMCNASFETIIAREVGIEDKLNVAGIVTIDSDLDITGIATATVLVAGRAVLNTATVTTLNGYTPITSGNISLQYVMYAATAGKLTNDDLAGLNIGHSTQPVYFNAGIPVACTRYADASVNYATTAALAVADKQGNDITTTYTKKTETRSTGYAIGKLSNLISELEDWVSNPTADTAYFNELGIRDKLNVSGLSTFNANVSVNANIVATGAITAGSDARYKNKLQDVAVDIKTIANAPLFNFRWNDGREDNRTYLGTTAQYWAETNFHNAVIPTTDEKLWTMSYSQIAMGNTIVLARELLPIKRKVSEINNLMDRLHKAENRITELEQELNQYRRA